MPFDNLSGDPAGDRLADALTENVITNLSLSRDLFVIARNSTLTYKDRSVDPRQIGRELGVIYILEGSIQASSDRVRITAQLIEAATGRHVSSNRYDRPLEDIFAIQDEVSEKVAGTLTDGRALSPRQKGPWRAASRRPICRPTITTCSGSRPSTRKRRRTTSGLRNCFGRRSSWTRIRARLYRVGFDLWLRDLAELHESRARSLRDWLAAVQKAVALDPYDGEAHMVLGYAYRMQNDYEPATHELDRGLELQPNSPDIDTLC